MSARNAYAKMVTPAWVGAIGPAGDVVISTRARLARNVDGIIFPSHARDNDLKRVADLVSAVVYDSETRFGKLRIVNPKHLTAFERAALVDSHVTSGQHVNSGSYRPVVVNEAGTLSLMVNEEDHLRIQCLLPGLQPLTALQAVREFEAVLSSRIRFARTDNYGYLTSSLSNIGTGLRLSVMLHLGALAMLGEAIPALTAAKELKISVRGLFGEGTKAIGDLFQVSNETTIGFSEKEITARVRAAAEHLVSREREARRKILNEKRDEFTDLVQSLREQLLRERAIEGREAMRQLSILRLGGILEVPGGITPRTFNELMVSMGLGAAASTARTSKPPEGVASDQKRARQIREKLLADNKDVQLAFRQEGEPYN